MVWPFQNVGERDPVDDIDADDRDVGRNAFGAINHDVACPASNILQNVLYRFFWDYDSRLWIANRGTMSMQFVHGGPTPQNDLRIHKWFGSCAIEMGRPNSIYSS